MKPDPSGLSSTSATNGLNKREQQKVVSDDDYEEQEENEQQNKQFSIPEVEKTRSHESQYRPSVWYELYAKNILDIFILTFHY